MNRWAVVALAVTFLAGCRDVTGPEMPIQSPLFSHATAGTWTNTANLSVGRHFFAAAAASSDGKVYVSGGLDELVAPLALVEAYDPAADAWSEVAPLPGDRFFHASVRAGDGLIYVIGGVTGGGTTLTNSVESYDVSANSWGSATSMTVVRGAPAAAVAGGKIYVTGGQNPDRVEASGEVYDPVSDTWTPIASMATPRLLHAMATGPDGRVYAIGGTNLETAFIASVEAYDPVNDEWTEVASLPSGRQGLGAATAADGHIYAYGGEAGNPDDVESTVFSYDVATDTWTAAPSMNQARFGFAATAGPDGRIYAVAGGSRVSGKLNSLNSAEWYLPVVETTVMVDIDIKPGGDPNSINRAASGNVPVAVLGSSTFDATAIDPSTVEFAGAPALRIGGGPEDVNGDGLSDVVFHFAIQALELPDGTTQACLTGQTTDETNVEGCDAVRLVK